MEPRDRDKILNNMKQLIDRTQWSPDLEASLTAKGVFRAKMLDLIKENENDDDGTLRRFYIAVTKRGPRAFGHLVTALTETGNSAAAYLLDPTVHVEVDAAPLGGMEAGVASGKVWNPPTYAVPPPQSAQLSDNFHEIPLVKDKTPLKVQVKTATQYKGPPHLRAYPMTKKPRGHCLIIDNEKFENDVYPFREGSHIDSNNLDILFEQLGFKVTVRRNLGYGDMTDTLQKFASLPQHKDGDMCIVVILSHGESGLICASDGRPISVEWLLRHFNNDSCPQLKGKPKFFIFQACRGDDVDYGHIPQLESQLSATCAVDAKGLKPEEMKQTIDKDPTWEDMLVLFATLPGFVANRNHFRGTWLVECLCKVFMTRSCDLDIREMLDEVARELKYYESEFGTKQSCTYECRHFYDKLYFNPGWYQEEEEAKETTLETQLDQIDIQS